MLDIRRREFIAGLAGAAAWSVRAQAQRAMIADSRYASPYYWAAYDVSGNGFWGRLLV